jgi:selenocysteine lyase/cysteine desulfurase
MSTGNGYQSIGSFMHEDNLEHLMSLSEADYRPPELPFDGDISKEMSGGDGFLLDRSSWTFLNHGAFGAALSCGHFRAQQWRNYCEEQPLRYFDRDLLPHLVYSARRLAKFVQADPTGIILSQNATTLLNAVIAGHVRTCREQNREPTIVLWDTSYGSVKKMARHYGARVVEIPFQKRYLSRLWEQQDCEQPEQAFLDALDDTLERHYQPIVSSLDNSALLVLDHTTSNTALTMPIEMLAERAREHGMLVCVDGAHGLLAQDLQLSNAPFQNIDFYISNGHKWLSCVRGVAMLYCRDAELRRTVLRLPPIVSHGIDDGYFSRFVWDGTRDYAAQLSLPVVLDYWEKENPAKVRATMREKLTEAIGVLSDMWHGGESGPGTVTIAPESLLSPMALVKLPEPHGGNSKASPKSSIDAKRVQDCLYKNSLIEVPIKAINGVLYVRLSCHVYNELYEYERLGRVMLEMG